MNKKFIVIIALVLVSASLLAACGSSAPVEAGAATEQTETAVTGETITEQAPATEEMTETEEAETDEAETEEAETEEATESVGASSGGMSFANDVLPILQANCTRCHGSSRQSGGVRLDSYASLTAGSTVVPGDAAGSLLVRVIESGLMPRGGSRLSDGDLQVIRDWVDGGALDN